ncbi:hypothetical protein PCK2_000847 [Pneumocystis canis]|nr:hypothetical protein PCK2_000847 [Pneumocystis canis]
MMEVVHVKTRIRKDSEEKIYQILKWAKLYWDEGPIVLFVGGEHSPYHQSKRLHIYSKYANILLKSGYAYRCFCCIDRLEKLKEASRSQGLSGTYDRNCLSISTYESNERALKGDKFVIRFKTSEKYPVVHDIIYGDIDFSISANIQKLFYDDPIIIKSDSFPTYHFASVIDDHLMNVTHVIRGEDWLSSTSKHLAIYQAFGWIPPAFAHVSLLVNPDGSKLSKRNNDTYVQNYIDKEKLDFLHRQHFLRATENEIGIKNVVEEIKPKIISLYKKTNLKNNNIELFSDEYICKIIAALRKKVQNINQLIQSSHYFFVEPNYHEHMLNEFKITRKELGK